MLVFTRLYRQFREREVIKTRVKSLPTGWCEESRPRDAVLARDEFELFELVRRVGVCVRAERVRVSDDRHENARVWFSFSGRVFSVLTRQTRLSHVAASIRRLRVRVIHRSRLDFVRQRIFNPTLGETSGTTEKSARVSGRRHRIVRLERD